MNWDHLLGAKSTPPSPSLWMVVTWDLTPPLQISPQSVPGHPLPAPLTLCGPSPPRDQPAQGVHGQGDEEGQHQVPQYNPRQHTRAHHGAVAFWECMWHWGQGRSMGVGNWEEVSVGFGEIWEETEMRNREGNFRI